MDELASEWQPIEVYSKHAFQHHPPFWRQFTVSTQSSYQQSGRLLEAVQLQIDDYSRNFKSGDIFNIFLIGHGNDEGVILGNEVFHAADLANHLDHFRSGVRVNVIVQSCSSGSSVDRISARHQHQRFVHASSQTDQSSYTDARSPSGRYRNSVFTGGFLKSLVHASRPAAKDNWTLQAHHAFVAREGKSRPPTPADPQHWTNIDYLNRFIDVIFTDYVEVSFTQTQNTACRVVTPPNLAEPIVSTPTTQPSEELLELALKLVKDEMDMTHRDPPRIEDMRFDSAYEGCLGFKRSIKGRLSGDNLNLYRRQVLELVDGYDGGLGFRNPFTM